MGASLLLMSLVTTPAVAPETTEYRGVHGTPAKRPHQIYVLTPMT
jgi:hypothetical protein